MVRVRRTWPAGLKEGYNPFRPPVPSEELRSKVLSSPAPAPESSSQVVAPETDETPLPSDYDQCTMELKEVVGEMLGLLSIKHEQGEVAQRTTPKQEFRYALCHLRSASSKLEQMFKVLAEVATCPITLQSVQRPMLAPDGQSYEQRAISKWLRVKGVSPVTRDPMRMCQLLRNRPLEQLLGVLRAGHQKDTDEDETDCGTEEDERESDGDLRGSALEVQAASSFGGHLITAIETQDEEAALALASGPLDDAVLNGQHGELQGSVLHLALLNGMPEVALLLAGRADTSNFHLFMGSPEMAISALHLAAALGNSSFCEVFIQRSGLLYARLPVLDDIRVTLSTGEVVFFRRGACPAEIAMQHGHEDLHRVISAAAEQILDYDGELQRYFMASLTSLN